jgi:manganese transport protein
METKPKQSPLRSGDKRTIDDAGKILSGKSKKGKLASLLPFLGPAFIASVAYVDPGNFATNITAGAQFGYTLLWVILASNLMAILIQTLSAKLGIASGLNLAEQCRTHFPKPVVVAMWVLMELVAIATDMAEFLGAALGLNLLFGVPMWLAGLLTGLATFIILGFERYGFRPLEAVITGMVAIVAISYVVETFIVRPNWGQVAYHMVVPQFSGAESILVATGILGATVMPHAIFLHSALTQSRIVVKDPRQMQRLFHYEIIDVLIAMGVASLVNGAMLIMSASTFFEHGMQGIGSIQEAYKTLQPLMGNASSLVFGVALLASGLSSASVGTMAGQVIMQGFLHREIPIWLRRMVTMVPSLIVIAVGLDPTRTLVISQVLLSFGLPFAIIPLVMFTSRKDIMGILVNHKITTLAVSMIAGLIVLLNFYLIFQTITAGG